MASWWRKASGISRAKRAVSKATGVPTTRSGRRQKAGRWLGCSVVAVGLLLGVAAIALADDKPDVAELKKQLKEAEAKVAELKAKLGEAEGEANVFKDATLIAPGLMKVGEKGQLNNPNSFKGGVIDCHKIAKILGDDSFILQPDERDSGLPELIVKGYPTKGMADGQLLPFNGRIVWKVVGTEKYRNQTLMVLRPEDKPLKADPPKKIDPKLPKKK